MAQMTKAQLVDENIRLRHNIAVLERKLHELTSKLVALPGATPALTDAHPVSA